jgi:NTP pyrophosphatase (non-canonical NTP hydrolase)
MPRVNGSHFMEFAFIRQMDQRCQEVYATAIRKGWWQKPRSEGELIALMHSELSEALEGLRHGNPKSEHIPEFSAVEEEFADVLIRIMDYSAHYKLRLGQAVLAKMKFNEGREYMHGGKKF